MEAGSFTGGYWQGKCEQERKNKLSLSHRLCSCRIWLFSSELKIKVKASVFSLLEWRSGISTFSCDSCQRCRQAAVLLGVFFPKKKGCGTKRLDHMLDLPFIVSPQYSL